MVFHDASAIILAVACVFMSPFIDLVSLCVEYTRKTQVDKFLHRELKDLASVVSYYTGAHLIAELDNFPAMEQTYGCL